ncbi:MAG: type II toxin-antitoxin system VapC family toxin [Chloroflexota bacterium]
MAEQVCVDASFVLAELLQAAHEPEAEVFWRRWVDGDISLVAPPLFFAEVTSVLRGKVFHGQIGAAEGERVFSVFLRLQVDSVNPVDLQERAWALAKKYNRPKAYDAQYLAVAEMLGCDLWTADQRLANAVREKWVRLAR